MVFLTDLDTKMRIKLVDYIPVCKEKLGECLFQATRDTGIEACVVPLQLLRQLLPSPTFSGFRTPVSEPKATPQASLSRLDIMGARN